jgi:hypothetical protein
MKNGDRHMPHLIGYGDLHKNASLKLTWQRSGYRIETILVKSCDTWWKIEKLCKDSGDITGV